MQVWSEATFTIGGDDFGSEIIFCFGPASEESELIQFLDRLQTGATGRRIKTIAKRRGPPQSDEIVNVETISKDIEAILDEILVLHSFTGGAMDL